MTETQLELLNSLSFAVKRIKELSEYSNEIQLRRKRGEISFDRFRELTDSTHGLYNFWLDRYWELKAE